MWQQPPSRLAWYFRGRRGFVVSSAHSTSGVAGARRRSAPWWGQSSQNTPAWESPSGVGPDSLKFAQQRRVLCQDRLHGSVVSFSGASYIVDLENASCTCGHFQVNNIPCGHAIALINKLNLQPRDVIPKYFLLTTYKESYTEIQVAVNIADLTPDGDDCYPPHLRKPRGRPKEKRLRKGERRRREIAARPAVAGALAEVPDNTVQRCSQCRGVGHNRTTCRDVVQFPIGGL